MLGSRFIQYSKCIAQLYICSQTHKNDSFGAHELLNVRKMLIQYSECRTRDAQSLYSSIITSSPWSKMVGADVVAPRSWQWLCLVSGGEAGRLYCNSNIFNHWELEIVQLTDIKIELTLHEFGGENSIPIKYCPHLHVSSSNKIVPNNRPSSPPIGYDKLGLHLPEESLFFPAGQLLRGAVIICIVLNENLTAPAGASVTWPSSLVCGTSDSDKTPVSVFVSSCATMRPKSRVRTTSVESILIFVLWWLLTVYVRR